MRTGDRDEIAHVRGLMRIGLWIGATGGDGRAADYLGWLSAQWVLFITLDGTAPEVSLTRAEAARARELFDDWLDRRFGAHSTPCP